MRLLLSSSGTRRAVSRPGFGIAWPVSGRKFGATNCLGWSTRAELEPRFGLVRVELLNDLEALAHGIAALVAEDLAVLQRAGEEAPGNRALIAAGTGLGQAGLFRRRRRTGLSPAKAVMPTSRRATKRRSQVLRFLLRRHQRVSAERVVSGPGLVALYDFVLEKNAAGRRPRSQPPDRTRRRPPSPHAAPCRQLARRPPKRSTSSSPSSAPKPATWRSKPWPAAGSTWAAASPQNPRQLREPAFREAFCAQGRMRPLLEAMPLKVHPLRRRRPLRRRPRPRLTRIAPAQPASAAVSASIAKLSSV